ncbi:UTRA domain-containing protein, partial [Streptacidiphilus albus]|uniref:UTRA domain-containing protein n=1 Tax=Streptacidiphilus albus TaxID=105425 RepID=UPI0005A9AEC6
MHWSPWDGDSAERAGALGAGGATTVVERVSSRLPTPNEVATLRLTPRTSVLVIERTTADASGRVVEAALLALPGDAEAVFATELLDQLEDES